MTRASEAPAAIRPRRSWRKALTRWVVEAVIIYVGVIIVLSALENWMVYHPIPAGEEWIDPAAYNLTVQDVELHTADGTRLHAWWCPVEGVGNNHATEALLYCHG